MYNGGTTIGFILNTNLGFDDIYNIVENMYSGAELRNSYSNMSKRDIWFFDDGEQYSLYVHHTPKCSDIIARNIHIDNQIVHLQRIK